MSVGVQLRQAREARRLSLADVTAATKIQPWILESLEADRLHAMMSPIYARGFLASYARFLNLPPEALLAQIPWTAAQEAEAPEAPAQPAAIPSVITWNVPWPLLRRIGARAAAVAAVIGVILVNPLRWVPKITLPPAPRPSFAAAKPAHHKKVAAKELQKPLKLASVAPVKETIQVPVPPPAPVAKIEPLELTVTATKATWIRVRADGKLLTQQRLERGAKEHWVGKTSLEVVVARPSQVELSLNGQSISSSAIQYDGRMVITHKGIARLPDDAT